MCLPCLLPPTQQLDPAQDRALRAWTPPPSPEWVAGWLGVFELAHRGRGAGTLYIRAWPHMSALVAPLSRCSTVAPGLLIGSQTGPFHRPRSLLPRDANLILLDPNLCHHSRCRLWEGLSAQGCACQLWLGRADSCSNGVNCLFWNYSVGWLGI